ncbi:MAG: c-type cytochrome [Fuerstiella sp.]|nr:c-type cytochrome [Fuerstiella sp.]
MLSLLILLALLPQQSDSLLDAVNSERGGRHWIDQKPDPPKNADDSQKCFQIEPGSRIELVAAEPLIVDPVWIDFDQQGRMFVVEYSDYPVGSVNEDGTENKDAPPLSKIVLLEDENGDGRMDKRTVFADELTFCHSFMPLMGGLLAGAQTQIIFLKDTDGDNVADVREVWFDGFTPAHPQMQIGCPRWGMDNWIYLTYAPGNVRCRRPGFETEQPVKMPRQDMKFDPRTMKFESISGMGQFGNTIDNDGNRFFCTNRNPIMMEIIPQNAATRNPFVTISKRHTDVGPSGGDTLVFPLVAMKSNYLSHAGTHTSACGVTAYRGDLWDNDFQHSVFACEPIGHLVTRSIIEPQKNSPALTARRARPDADFLASSDTWFRPASLRTGPNGGLYIADMYRMWVEHPKFLPPEIAARIDWREGEDKGRLWRIVPEKDEKPENPFVPPTSSQDLVNLLKDSNGWRRQIAQQGLVESSDPKIADQLRELLKSSETPLYARVQAIWCLHGRNEVECRDITRSFNFSNATERDQQVKLQMKMCEGRPKQFAMQAAARSSDPSVRFKAILSSTHETQEASQQQWTQVLTRLGRKDGRDSWFQDVLLVHSENRPQDLFNVTSRVSPYNPGKLRSAPEHNKDDATFLFRIAQLVGRSGGEAEISGAIFNAAWASGAADWMTAAILKGLASGLRSNKNKETRGSLAGFLKDPPDRAAKDCAKISELLQQLTDVAVDSSAKTSDRKAAIEMLTLQSRTEVTKVVEQLLVPGTSGELQQSALEVVRQTGAQETSSTILQRWNTLAPTVRSTALALLMARPNTTTDLLNSMINGSVPSASIDIDQRMRLLQHRDQNIRKLAVQIFGGVVSANRKAVADEYQPALTMDASAERGAAVFAKTCIKCHKIDGKGHNVGPDISDTRRRSRDALLYDILDPNRRVDPQFSDYVVVTTDGRTYNGLLVIDSGAQVVLRQPEGKEQTIARTDIEEMQTTNKSLMPEGVEKDVSVQQMADLLEFLKAR